MGNLPAQQIMPDGGAETGIAVVTPVLKQV